MSELVAKGKLVYLGVKNYKSKKGNEFEMVTIGDSLEMQRHEFFKDASCDLSGLNPGDPVKVTLNLDTVGYNQRLNLIRVEKANG